MATDNKQARGMSARAASVNSLDLLEAPTIPRVKTRDVTRSMSDAVATKTQSKAPKLVTETELSSSWLYKTMQASINARFKSPRKSPSVQKTSDLEQSILQDSELKPIPMNSKAAKTSSCICHFATMIAISLCTVGFLASIAAIIYMEVFADRNITSLHATEAEVDLSDVVLDSLETYNLTTLKVEGEEHILNEALTHKFDGDEEILNEVLKASSTNDLPSLSSKSNSHGPLAEHITDSNTETLELKQYRNVTKVKFQDGVTVVYEMKSEESTEDDIGSNFIPEFKGRSFGIGFHKTDEDSFDDNSEKSTESVPEKNLKQELGITEFEGVTLNESVSLEKTNGTDWVSHDFSLNGNQLKDNLKKTVSEDEFKLKGISEKLTLDDLQKNESTEQILQDVTIPSEKLNLSGILQSKDTEFEISPNPDTNDVFRGNVEISLPNKVENYEDRRLQTNKESDALSTNVSESQTIQDKDSQSILKVNDHPVEDEHDVNTMLVTIDDTEVSTDSFISKRNGEVKLFQVSSPIPSVEPIKQMNSNSFTPPKKPVDIKVSLAEAMKHLQSLDVSNKILTSRTKPKQKVKNVQKPKRKIDSKKDEERKRYLQHMRLILSKQLQ